MNNEPVAWLVQYKDRHEFRWSKPEHLFEALACEPLYTHPSEHDLGIAEAIGFDKGYKAATAKTLTDEEIDELWDKYLRVRDEYGEELQILGVHDFARAILKKASEK
jgi:hypothetical protein